MLKLTRTGIGLLTRQYRSVLKKCWAINVGIFALGAAGAAVLTPSQAEAQLTETDIFNMLGTVSADGTTVTGTSGHTTWTQSGSAVSAFAWQSTSLKGVRGSGVTKIGDKYFKYAYQRPSGYSLTSTQQTSGLSNKVMVVSSTSHGGAFYITGSTQTTILADTIVSAAVNGGYIGGGVYISNSNSYNTITGDFIRNSARPDNIMSVDSRGGAIYNGNNISSIRGDFIGNYVTGTKYDYVSAGGAIYNYGGTIVSLTGNFIGNYTDSTTAKSYGGAIFNYSGRIGILADTQNVVFYGNETLVSSGAKSYYNDIYNAGTINLDAASGKSIFFGGTVYGGDNVNPGTINIGTRSDYNGGAVIFANTVSRSSVNLGTGNYGGKIYPALVQLRSVKQPDGTTSKGSFDSATNLYNYSSDSVLDTKNGYIDSNSLSSLTLNKTLGLKIDVAAVQKQADTIDASVVSTVNNSKLAIQDLNFGDWPDPDEWVSVQLTDTADLKSAYTLADGYTVSGSLADYIDQSTITVENGVLKFKTTSLGSGGSSAVLDYIKINQAVGTSTYPSAPAEAYGAGSIAIGDSAIAGSSTFSSDDTTFATAVGFHAEATSTYTTAVGYSNTASGSDSNAFGAENTASGNSSSAFGRSNTASGSSSSAFGYYNIASNTESSAFGSFNTASSSGSNAFGNWNEATGKNSSAFGNSNSADGNSSSAVGRSNKAYGVGSNAFGYQSIAGTSSITSTENMYATALGTQSSASLASTTAIGYQAVTSEAATSTYGILSVGHRNGDAKGYTSGNYTSDYFTRIINVADGVHAHDAVTVGQLNSTLTSALTGYYRKVEKSGSLTPILRNFPVKMRNLRTP